MADLDKVLAQAEALIQRVERLLPPETPAPDFAGTIAFRWRRRDGRSVLQPVAHPHRIQLEDLQDIDRQRELVRQKLPATVQRIPFEDSGAVWRSVDRRNHRIGFDTLCGFVRGAAEWQLIARVTFHDLRHDFAHRARAAGWSLEEVAYYLGHLSKTGTPAIQTTVRYTQVSRDQVRPKLRQIPG